MGSGHISQVANRSYQPISHPPAPYRTFESFYPFYLGEHSNRLNRLSHLTGTGIISSILARILLSAVPTIVSRLGFLGLRVRNTNLRAVLDALSMSNGQRGKWLLIAIVQAYTFAWLGHFFVEKNRPATFKYPLFSLRGDFRMFWEVITLQRAL